MTKDKLDDIALQHVQSFVKGNRTDVIREIAKLPSFQAVAISARVAFTLPYNLQCDFINICMSAAEADAEIVAKICDEATQELDKTGVCPACGKNGQMKEGCPTCPGFWYE